MGLQIGGRLWAGARLFLLGADPLPPDSALGDVWGQQAGLVRLHLSVTAPREPEQGK